MWSRDIAPSRARTPRRSSSSPLPMARPICSIASPGDETNPDVVPPRDLVASPPHLEGAGQNEPDPSGLRFGQLLDRRDGVESLSGSSPSESVLGARFHRNQLPKELSQLPQVSFSCLLLFARWKRLGGPRDLSRSIKRCLDPCQRFRALHRGSMSLPPSWIAVESRGLRVVEPMPPPANPGAPGSDQAGRGFSALTSEGDCSRSRAQIRCEKVHWRSKTPK